MNSSADVTDHVSISAITAALNLRYGSDTPTLATKTLCV